MAPAHAQERLWENERVDSRQLVVTVNKSRTIRIVKPFASAIVGATDIAEALPMSEHSLYIQGKKVGTTNLSIFDADKKLISVIDVDVGLDTASLREKLVSSTGVKGIRVSSSNNQIVLSGQVPNALIADQAMTLAKSMAGNIPVANAMSIASAQQVMLRVRFLEASRNAGRDLGVNWFASNKAGNQGVNTGLGGALPGPLSTAGTTISPSSGATGAGGSTPGGVPLFQTLGTLAGTATSAPFGVALARVLNSGSGNIDVLITALETKGLIRRLAEPDLVALSGDTASFIAGGQIPVPVVQPGLTASITIDYKPFGVQLTFVPTVLANGVINLRLTPSVSELDFTNAVLVSGFRIPALTLREARTTIELRDGQSFSIAGLLQSDGLRNISEVPWLGSVPVLGALFRSTSYQQSETDLVVIVTAHLVAPGVPGQKIASPLDSRAPSNDVDLFVLGQTDVRKKKSDDVVGPGGSDRPPTGYIMPVDAK